MRGVKMRLWVLGLLAVACASYAQVGGNGAKVNGQFTGQRIAGVAIGDTSTRVLRVDTATNGLVVSESSKDRDNYQVVNVCDDTVSVADFITSSTGTLGQPFTAESSLVIPTYAYRRFTLMLRVIPQATDTTSRFRFAVQVRKHTDATGDSASTFAWSEWAIGTGSSYMTTAGDDSTGHFVAADFANGGSAVGALPWSNERVFVLTAERGNAVASGSVGMSFGWPGGIAVDLVDARGQFYWAPYTSIRIRCLSNGKTNVANKPRIIAKLAMGS